MATSKRLVRRRNIGWTSKRLIKHRNFRFDADSRRFVGARPGEAAVRSGETATPSEVTMAPNDDGAGAQGAGAARAGQPAPARSLDSPHAARKAWALPPVRKAGVEGSRAGGSEGRAFERASGPASARSSGPTSESAPEGATDYEALLGELGRQIATGSRPAGTVMTLADLEAEFGVSRTLVRDVVKVLEGLGMVTSRRRVGVTVEPRGSWQLLDPHVIAWRMYDVDERRHHILEISELRRGIEPEAARLAASRGLPGAERLVELAERMRDLGVEGRGADPEFLAADIEFHELVSSLSGNEIFARLGAMVGSLLVERTHWDLQPAHPDADAVRCHIRLARAIRDGDPETAAESASFIVVQAADEVGGVEAHSNPAN